MDIDYNGLIGDWIEKATVYTDEAEALIAYNNAIIAQHQKKVLVEQSIRDEAQAIAAAAGKDKSSLTEGAIDSKVAAHPDVLACDRAVNMAHTALIHASASVEQYKQTGRAISWLVSLQTAPK